MALPYVIDSRRVMGRNLWLPAPCALLECAPPLDRRDRIVTRWRRAAKTLLRALGWADTALAVRKHASGVQLALAARIDLLLVATYVNEDAYELALAAEGLCPAPDPLRLLSRLEARAERAAEPGLAALIAAAESRRVLWLYADDELSLGAGAHAQLLRAPWPAPRNLNWRQYKSVPTVLVTGTNGKTTCTRLIARMLTEAGHCVGLSTTAGVQVGDQWLSRDDYAGPGGARLVLRHPQTTAAVLETARGGLNRRGTQVSGADVALITNVAADHLGEDGIHSVADIALAKSVVAQALRPGGKLVLPFDDPILRGRVRQLGIEVCWFSDRPDRAFLDRARQSAIGAAVAVDGVLCLAGGGHLKPVIAIDQVPFCFSGAALHNVRNALAAIAVARCLRLSYRDQRAALARFGASPDDNPGRANHYQLANNVHALFDFGHNPDALNSLFDIADSLPHRRRIILLGQAGDRRNGDIEALADIARRRGCDHYIVKELASYHRGRAPGVVPALLKARLCALGVADEAIDYAHDDLTAVEQALAMARPGDQLLLLIHEQAAAVRSRLDALDTARGVAP